MLHGDNQQVITQNNFTNLKHYDYDNKEYDPENNNT